MSLFVKICGISDRETAVVACRAGADAIGFVFADSLRRVTPERATAIARGLPEQVARVAVFLRPDQDEVNRLLAGFDADLVQADHDSGLVPPPGVEFLPVFRDAGAPLRRYLEAAHRRRLLFEGPRSGSGVRADWEQARRVAIRGRVILAGGLTPENVVDAIEAVDPYGVDVSSGVESAPGVKSEALIERFITAARRTRETRV